MSEPILYPVGTRVQDEHGLTGRIKAIEYIRTGAVSAIPYCVEWDDIEEASRKRGWLFVYAMHEEISPV